MHKVSWEVTMPDGTQESGEYDCANETEVRIAVATINEHYDALNTSEAKVTHSVMLNVEDLISS